MSVVILNYNGARWIRPCIESVFKQTIRDQIELIVADNKSTDGWMLRRKISCRDTLTAGLCNSEPITVLRTGITARLKSLAESICSS